MSKDLSLRELIVKRVKDLIPELMDQLHHDIGAVICSEFEMEKFLTTDRETYQVLMDVVNDTTIESVKEVSDEWSTID